MMETRTEFIDDYGIEDAESGINTFEDAGWAVRSIIPAVNSEAYVVVFERERPE